MRARVGGEARVFLGAWGRRAEDGKISPRDVGRGEGGGEVESKRGWEEREEGPRRGGGGEGRAQAARRGREGGRGGASPEIRKGGRESRADCLIWKDLIMGTGRHLVVSPALDGKYR